MTSNFLNRKLFYVKKQLETDAKKFVVAVNYFKLHDKFDINIHEKIIFNLINKE